MANTIYGDLHVKRSITADRRLNQGLSKETISTTRVLNNYDFAWIQIINASTQDVVLPDATTCENGWSIVVSVDSTSGASTNVKSYDAITPVLLRNILVGRAYRFSLLDNSTASGEWHIDFLEEADRLISQRYVDTFNATTDWSGPTNGYYSRTVSAATHGMSATPFVTIREGSNPYYDVIADQLYIENNGDITIKVTQAPDLRFAGQMIVM